jgi:hypothetical protein
MYLPDEIQSIIISFVPHTDYSSVCKYWNYEIKKNQKIAVNTIGLWYKHIKQNPKKINFINRYIYDYIMFVSLIPNLIVKTLELNEILLDILPIVRKPTDVRYWLLNLPLDEQELLDFLFTSLYS